MTQTFRTCCCVRYAAGARDWLGRRDGYLCRHVRGTHSGSKPVPICSGLEESSPSPPVTEAIANTAADVNPRILY